MGFLVEMEQRRNTAAVELLKAFFSRSLGSAQDKNRLGSDQDEKSQSNPSGCGITPTLILGRGPPWEERLTPGGKTDTGQAYLDTTFQHE